MSRRARAIGLEHAEMEAQMEATNEALARDQRRREIAKELAQSLHGSADVIFEPFDAADDWKNLGVESRDGGYWVAAKVWVPFEDVEDELDKSPRLKRLERYIAEYGEGRQEDMDLDLKDVSKYLLIQSYDNEPWYVLLDSPEDGADYIRQDYPQWDFEAFIDLDTGGEYDLSTQYSLIPKEKA